MRGEKPSTRIDLMKGCESEPNRLLQQWFDGPVVLASTSAYRRDRLVDTGFNADRIQMVPTSDAAEKSDLDRHVELVKKNGNLYDIRPDQNASRQVAIGKVRAVLSTQAVSPETLVIAADTVTYSYAESGYRVESRPHTKVPEKEEAEKFINGLLLQIARDYIHTRYVVQLSHFLNQYKLADPIMGNLPYESHYNLHLKNEDKLKVTVNTAVAVRLPNTGTIMSYIQTLDLYPTAVFDAVDRALDNKVRELTDQDKAEVMGKVTPEIKAMTAQIVALHPELVTKVAGAIPFHDPAVRDILKVGTFKKEELTTNFTLVDDGVYKGLDATILLNELSDWARKLEAHTT